jgi:enoyl-[acyl-carrier protein] reductase II
MFYKIIEEAELRGASVEELSKILGKGRAKLGMFEGNMVDGELEIGQVSALIKDILPAGEIINQIWKEFNSAITDIQGFYNF